MDQNANQVTLILNKTMQQPTIPPQLHQIPTMYGTHPASRGTTIHSRQQQGPLGPMDVASHGGHMLGTSVSANMGLHQIQGRPQPDIILHPALFGPTVSSQRSVHPQVVPNVIPPEKRPSPSYLPALPPPPRSSQSGNPPIPQRGIPRNLPPGGGIPGGDPFIEEQVDMLAEKIESLEGELRYAWRALDVLSQEYVKMWQRLEKMEDLLSEQQTVITQLIDLYSVDNSGGSEDTGPENNGDRRRPLSSSPSHAIQSLAMDENFYKALNAMHASRSIDSTGGNNNSLVPLSGSGHSLIDGVETPEDDEDFSSPGEKPPPLPRKQGTFSDFLNEYDSLVKQQQKNRKGSKFGIQNGDKLNGKQQKQKGTGQRRNRAIGSQGCSPDDSDIDINRSLGEDTSPSGRSDSTALGRSSEQELGEFPIPSDLSPDYENATPPPPKMPPPPPPPISTMPPPLPSKGLKPTKKAKKQITSEPTHYVEKGQSSIKEVKSKKEKQKKDGNKRTDKRKSASPPDSRLPVGDGSAAEREAALFMAALSSGTNIPQNFRQEISSSIPADRIYETYPRHKDRDDSNKSDLNRHTSSPLTLVGGKYSFTVTDQHGNGVTGIAGGLLDEDSFDPRTAQPVANGKPLFTSMQTAMKPPSKLKTSRHKNDNDSISQKQHRAHSISGGIELGQEEDSNYRSKGKKTHSKGQSKSRSQSVSIDPERTHSSETTVATESQAEEPPSQQETSKPCPIKASAAENNQASDASSTISQQKQQPSSRKLSLKEKRKLRAERELAPREIDVMPVVTTPTTSTPTAPIQKQSDTQSNTSLLQPPISNSSSSGGGGPSPTSVKRLMDSSGESDHSMKSELVGNNGSIAIQQPIPEAEESEANGVVVLHAQNNAKQRERAGSREFAVSRALGKYREKQKQREITPPNNKTTGSSNSDSLEDLDAASPTKSVSVSEENLPRRPVSMGEESSGGENIIATSSTSTSGPDASTAPWPADKIEDGKRVSKSSSISDERLEDIKSDQVDIDKEAKLEETLKNLDRKLAEIDGSLKRPSKTQRNRSFGSENNQEEKLVTESHEVEGDGVALSSEDQLELVEEQDIPKEYAEAYAQDEVNAANDDNIKEPTIKKNKDVVEMTPDELQVAAEKKAAEAADKAEKAAMEAAQKTAKAATAAFSIFGATKFGKMATKAASQAAAQAKAAADQAAASQQLAPPGSGASGGSRMNSRASSRVSSRRQSTEESIDSEDEWYRHEMRQLQDMEYETEASKIKPPQEVNEQMNGVFNELTATVKPVEKEECDKEEASRMAKQQHIQEKPKTPPPPQAEEPVPSTSKNIGDHKKVIMRFESSDVDDDEYDVDDDGAESDETSHDHARRKGVAKTDDSSENDSDATQSGPDSLMDDSSDAARRRSSIDDMLSDQSGKKKGISTKKKSSLTSVKAIKDLETDTQSSPSERASKIRQTARMPSQQSQSVETFASSKESISSSQPPDSKITTSDESTLKSKGTINKQITETSSKDSLSSKSAAADSPIEEKVSSASSKTSSKSSKRPISRKSITPTNSLAGARSPSGSANGKANENDNQEPHQTLEGKSSWMNTGAYEYSPGYYDENSEWIEQSGYYDENGDWVETGGYYTEDTGEYVEYAGYYDDNEEWIDVEPPDLYYASLEAFYANANVDTPVNTNEEYNDPNAYYDDGGGGGLLDTGGGGVMESGLEPLQEDVEGEEATKSSDTEEGTLNDTPDQQNNKPAGHFLASTGVVEPNNAFTFGTQTTPGKNYDDYYQEQFSQDMNHLDQYPSRQDHIMVDQDDTNDGLTTPDEMADEYIKEDGDTTLWNEEGTEFNENVEDDNYFEGSQINEVKDDSGSGLHNTIDTKLEESQHSFDQDTDYPERDVEKISIKSKTSKNSKDNSTSQNEKEEPSQTLEEIMVKQKVAGISAKDRWKSLKKTIDENRTDAVSFASN